MLTRKNSTQERYILIFSFIEIFDDLFEIERLISEILIIFSQLC